MTEAEWLAATDPEPKLDLVEGNASERKLRLSYVAAIRASWAEINLPDYFSSVEVAELFAEGSISEVKLQQALSDWSRKPPINISHPEGLDTFEKLEAIRPSLAPQRAIRSLRSTACWPSFRRIAGRRLAAALNDIFGNPFRPVTINRSWLTSTVLTLAQQMYDSRDFSPMPILADALQDAGCDNEDMLNHCRQPGEHVRGCFVVDLLLGKS
jgi:hypothetical protein